MGEVMMAAIVGMLLVFVGAVALVAINRDKKKAADDESLQK